MYRIQEFMKPHTFEETNGNRTILPEIINPKFPAERNFQYQRVSLECWKEPRSARPILKRLSL